MRRDARRQVVRVTSEKAAAELPGTVKVGDVFMSVPMVDQGPKGYCAPATITRIVQYYGHDTTMNEMAAMMETRGAVGTYLKDVREAIQKVTRRLRLSFRDLRPLSENDHDDARALRRWIDRNVIRYVDNGNPLFWTVPEHLRLIVGYNDQTGDILFSDSWGRPGFDRMAYAEAAKLTQALYVIR